MATITVRVVTVATVRGFSVVSAATIYDSAVAVAAWTPVSTVGVVATPV